MQTEETEARLGQAIRRGIEHGDGLLLHFQPVRHLWSGADTLAEALLRLRFDGQILEPHRFLAIGEHLDLQSGIDRWVARETIDVLARHKSFRRRLRIELNVSAASLGDFDFISLLDRRLTETRVSPRNLVLSVPEAVAVARPEAVGLFGRRIRALGCRFSLDRVGALHGAVTPATEELLLELPVDFVKLSGCLVRDLPGSTEAQEVIAELVAMTGRVGVETVGVYVEDEHTVHLLKMLGVDYAQGHFIGRPEQLDAVAEEVEPCEAAMP
jgi:EAL domain-containing protein (putative c-di-GMP-specific phosphodiesterase class I)